jgi:flagellar FliL protein
MSETAAVPQPRRRIVPLLVGLMLAGILGAGGFYGVRSGILPMPSQGPGAAPLGDVAFVPVPTVVVPMGSGPRMRHLRFTAQLEVPPARAAEVSHLMPRILDVLNGYLRAIDVADVEDRAGIFRLRAQMLRRVQIVTGEGRVTDLLITEFVLN